jgi:hypothetical protein
MTRIALLIALGLLLYTIGLSIDSLDYWAVLLSFLAWGWLERHEGRLEGVALILDMSMMKISRIKASMERVIKGDTTMTEEEFDKQLHKDDDDVQK